MSPVVPCALCGYHAPGPTCPHCGHAPAEPSLAAPLARGAGTLSVGVQALFRGAGILLRTRGLKRWLVPPLVLTSLLLAASLWFVLGRIGGWAADALPSELAWSDAEWLRSLAEDWGWLHAVLLWGVLAAEWLAELVLGVLTSETLGVLAGFLVASLVVWYCFSIAYEALAGPFLDEIQGRLEARWFGADPRARLERPVELSPASCARISTAALLAGGLLGLVGGLVLSWWLLPVAVLVALGVAALVRPGYGRWLAWVARVEGGALWVGIQASLVTGVLLVLALPLYFVPVAGYFLFAAVTGFATAVTLLDIATERRGWTLRQRLAFVRRYPLALVAFGAASGALLALPVVGPLLMVPSASIGGLWLLCRLDKGFLRPAAAQGARGPA